MSFLIRMQAQGLYDSDIVMSLDNRGYIYMQQNNVGEVEAFYRQALWIGEQLLGPEHSLISSIQVDLGMLYLQRENFAEAEPCFQKAAATWEKTQGMDHIYTVDWPKPYIDHDKFTLAEPVLHTKDNNS